MLVIVSKAKSKVKLITLQAFRSEHKSKGLCKTYKAAKPKTLKLF